MPHTWLCVQKPLGLPACRDGPVIPARQSRQLWQPPTGGDMDRPSLANSDLTWVLGEQLLYGGAEGTASCLLGPAAGFVFPGSPHLGNRTGTGGPPWHCPTVCHRARPSSTLSSLCSLWTTTPSSGALRCPLWAHQSWNRQAGMGWEGAKVGEGSQELKHGRCWNSGCNGAR